MDTVNIQIPAPDFNFADVVKLKAKTFISQYLGSDSILSTSLGMKGDEEDFYIDIDNAFYRFQIDGQKIVFIGELLLHLQQLKIANINSYDSIEQYGELISLLQFHLYNLGSGCNYNFDTNAFADNEVSDLNSKIDAILEKLNEIQLGQEIIFDDIAELKDDFESLKSDYPLGKKRWYQRATGLVVSYAGTKGADEVYELLKPLLHDFFTNHAQYFIDKL